MKKNWEVKKLGDVCETLTEWNSITKDTNMEWWSYYGPSRSWQA